MGNTLKKALTITVSAMTAFWSVGVAAFAPLAAAAAPVASAVAEGDLVKASLPAVYYVGANGKRYVFPNEKTYKTWWSGFSSVKTITDAQLAAVAIGGNVTYRPGARLVKITTDPKVYLVGANAELHPISDEMTAKDLFGTSWSQKVDDVPDAFFTNYTVSSSTVATALGAGALPVGTVVSFNGSNYLVDADGVWTISGSLPTTYGAVAMASSQADFDAWTGGSILGTISADDILGLVAPDRSGSLEAGTGSTPSTSGVTVKVKQIATNLAMASGQSQNVGKSGFEVCSDKTITVDGFDVSTASGTIGFNTIQAWAQSGDHVYSVTGTSNGDSIGNFQAEDMEATFSGCQSFDFFAATSSNGGVLNMRLAGVHYTTSGAAAAATVDGGNQVLQNRNAVPVSTTDLMDIAFSNGVNPANLQTDGTKQQIFSVQAAVSNNDAYIPNVTFKLNGSIMVSNCELRVSGAIVSTNYKWAEGKYVVFELPEASRLMTETTKTWELWCEVNGEAGQTVTPQLVWPAPYFWFFDNIRAMSAIASAPAGKEHVAPSAARMAVVGATNSGVTNLAGASATVESINLNNVKDSAGVTLDDEKTTGTTNTTVAVFKVKVRGSKATLSNLVYTMTGTNAAKGLTACQVKFGQRNDKGEISTSAVSLADYSMSNYGGENNVNSGGNVTVTANKQLQVGDWLIVVECDVITTAGAYANGDTQAIRLNTGGANLSFDVGTTANFPTGNVAGTTLTIRLLSALAVAANATSRYLVSNANGTVLGEYTITGPSQEGVSVSSIGITFAAGVAGTAGCSTVTLRNASGQDLTANSQSLTAAGTLTFSTTLTIAANTEYKVRVVCTQASSAPTPATVANATAFASISGTGLSSSQSFNTAAGLPLNGASVVVAASGTVTSSSGQNQPAQIIGPSETLKIMTITTAASIHEDQSLNTLNIILTAGSAALATDLATVAIKAEGFTVSGTAAAAETTICTRTVTGTTPVTISCVFNDGVVKLLAGQTGLITVYVTGNTLGSIGNDASPSNGIITPTMTATNSTATSNIVYKGAQSQVLVADTAVSTAVTGRVVTPAGAQVRFVNKSIPSTTLPGQSNMVLGKIDMIVSGTSVTLTELSGQCLTNDATNVCLNGSDTVTIALDSTVLAGGANLALSAATPALFDGSVITATLVTTGTHDLELRLTDAGVTCSTSDTVQLATDEIGFTVAGVPGVTQSFASAGPTAFPVNVLADFNTFASSRMTHPSNLCG